MGWKKTKEVFGEESIHKNTRRIGEADKELPRRLGEKGADKRWEKRNRPKLNFWHCGGIGLLRKVLVGEHRKEIKDLHSGHGKGMVCHIQLVQKILATLQP